MLKTMKLWLCLGAAALLAACGGGGGSSGAVPNQPAPDPAATATQRVADITVFLSKSSISNAGTDTVKVTATAVDASRNVVSGATVAVTTDNDSIFKPSVATGLTDASGTYSGDVSLGGSKADRVINVTVTSNKLVRKATILVTGTRLTLQVNPTSPAPGQNVAVSINLVDAAGNGLPDAQVTVGGNVPGISGTNRRTGNDGKITLTFVAPQAPGVYTVSAAGGGVVSGDVQVQVFSTVVPPTTIPPGVVPALSASPNVISANSPGTSTNRSVLRFLILDGQNRPVPGVRVKFQDLTTGLPTVGAVLVNSNVTLYTDASGIATTEYISGQNPSPTNGVAVRACYSGTDFTVDAPCPNSVVATLTVAGQALSVSIGDDNLLEKGEGTYSKRFVVSVADAAGRPVTNAPVDISVDLTHYGKATRFLSAGSIFPFVPTSLTQSATFNIGATPGTTTGTGTAVVVVPGSPGVTYTWCFNEDTNRNGFVDPGENVNGSVDSNGQPTLEPRKSDLLISYADPTKTSTDSSGLLQIKATYSQRFATWLAYRVRVIVNVQGSQGIAERLFVTDFIEGDDTNGSFRFPPYGTNSSCLNPN